MSTVTTNSTHFKRESPKKKAKKKQPWDEVIPNKNKDKPTVVRQGKKWYYLTKKGKKYGPFDHITPWGITKENRGTVIKDSKFYKVNPDGTLIPWRNPCCGNSYNNVQPWHFLKPTKSKSKPQPKDQPKTGKDSLALGVWAAKPSPQFEPATSPRASRPRMTFSG